MTSPQCTRYGDRPEGWIVFEGNKVLAARTDGTNPNRKKPGKHRLKWIPEVRREEQQVADCVKHKPDVDDLMPDKRAWAKAVRDDVILPV